MIDPHTDMPAWLEAAWMHRYLSRELTDSETAEFEAYCFMRDRLMDLIEQDVDLRDALAAHPPIVANEPTIASPVSPPRSRARSSWWSVAAMLAVGLGIGVPLGTISRPSPPLVANVPTVVVDTFRSSDAGAGVWAAGATSTSDVVVLQVLLAPEALEVTASLSGAPELTLHPSSEGVAALLVPRTLLGGTLRVRYVLGGKRVDQTFALPISG